MKALFFQEKHISRVQRLSRALLLTLLAMLWLIGCSNTSPTNLSIPNNPVVNATDTSTPLSYEGTAVYTCPAALQLITQNKVEEVEVDRERSNQGTDITVAISLFLRYNLPSNTGLVPPNELGVDLPSLILPVCKTQILDTVKQVNKGLSKEKQIQVDEPYVPNVSQ